MPPAINALAFAYLDGRSPDEAVRKFEPALVKVVDTEGIELEVAVAEQIDQLLEQGLAPQQIAVCTLCGMKASALWSLDAIGEHVVVHADDDRAANEVVLDTFFRLQGLDRLVVIVCEGDTKAAAYSYDTRMHQALTRARAGVVIMAGAKLWERDRVLSALRETGKLEGG
jgi:hypothetical protein